MSSKNDKRKQNRIQSGWGKSVPKKNSNEQKNEISANNCTNFSLEFDLQSGRKKAMEMKSHFNCIPIFDNFEGNLNMEADDLVSMPAANVKLINGFLTEVQANELMDYFKSKLPWEQRENVLLEGTPFLEPRKTCWFGLPYAYSGVKLPPNDNWDQKLLELREQVQEYAKQQEPFNSVFCNLYETCKNSIAWHADDEKSLGPQPTIASISLGCKRVFELCKRSEFYNGDLDNNSNPYRSRNKDEPPFKTCTTLYQMNLEPGSLLIMSGSVQDYWLHRVPKEYHDHQARINFTFRHIVPRND